MNPTAIMKYHRQPQHRLTDFVARYASRQSATRMLRRHSAQEIVLQLNAHGFPVERAADLIFDYLTEGRLGLCVDLICLAKYEVLEAIWQRHGSELVKWFHGSSPKKQLSALLFLHEFAYYLPVGKRGDILGGLNSIPKEIQLNWDTSLDTTGYTFCLKLRLKTMMALDQLDRFIAATSEQFPFDDLATGTVVERLEFFPTEDPTKTDRDTGMIFETRVSRDHTKIGTAIKTMQKMLRSEDITEDMIRRVQGTKYCQQPYGPAEPYRTETIWRRNHHSTMPMTPPDQIGPMMKELTGWVNSPRAKNLHPFIRAHIFYARYDQIHPFDGRTKHAARFFLFQMLLRGKNGIRYLPLFDELDLHLTLFFKAPYSIKSSFFFDQGFNAATLMREELYDEFVFQMLYLYTQKLSFYYKEFMGPAQKKAMDNIAAIMRSEAESAACVFKF